MIKPAPTRAAIKELKKRLRQADALVAIGENRARFGHALEELRQAWADQKVIRKALEAALSAREERRARRAERRATRVQGAAAQ
jgi:UDP-N-acetylmuramoylalanine-D-glutamate ligase